MKKILPIFLFITLLSNACHTPPDQATIEKWKLEIKEAEQNFAKMATEEGIPKAFLAFAAEDAVLMRNNAVVVGKQAIRERFENQEDKGDQKSLTWEPDFIDVAASGDLGYTYGKYVFSKIDSNGVSSESTGIFHTVWKRQADGTWKYVWD